jgi:hypothetical protein
MADPYLRDDEQQDLKRQLYSYLKDKATRRAGVTSGQAYDTAQEMIGRNRAATDAASLLETFSQAASMGGQLGGKRSDSALGGFSEGIANSGQAALNNLARMRQLEEQALGTDLNIGRFVAGLEQYDDTNARAERESASNLQTAELNREKLRRQLAAKIPTKRTFQYELLGPGDRPVVLDEEGIATELPPGFKIRNKPVAGQQASIVSGVYDKDGNPIEKRPDGTYAPAKLPEGSVVASFQKDVAAAADALAHNSSMIGNFELLDKALGAALDEIEVLGNQINQVKIVNGQPQKTPKDIPGRRVFGLGQVDKFTPEAKAFDAALARILNITLKDRSGAAVTIPEMERLKQEIGSGRFNNEADVIRELKNFKTALLRQKETIEAGFPPQAVAEFQRRRQQAANKIGGSGPVGQQQAPAQNQPNNSQGPTNKLPTTSPNPTGFETLSDEELRAMMEKEGLIK